VLYDNLREERSNKQQQPKTEKKQKENAREKDAGSKEQQALMAAGATRKDAVQVWFMCECVGVYINYVYVRILLHAIQTLTHTYTHDFNICNHACINNAGATDADHPAGCGGHDSGQAGQDNKDDQYQNRSQRRTGKRSP